ncbi:hypothetical protein ACIP93_05495 [Streptomyces sp. NPDC088745]|uniref:hypothetical protein n=1 Tax=Streptomyces sp. NPDC088745 TaxID=3365884 RepID=UPI0038007F7F
MIEASVNALPGVTVFFLVLAVLVGPPAALWARARGRSALLASAAAVLLAGALAVTLAPGRNTAPVERVCATGTSLHGALQTVPGQLNAVIFLFPCLLLVLATRRPLTSLGVTCLVVPGVEAAQALLPLGRSCTFIDLGLNCLGAGAGWGAGALLLVVRDRAGAFPRSEVVRGAAFTAGGALAVLALFHSAITPVAGLSDGQDLTPAQADWARATSTALFGPQARVINVQQTPQLGEQPLRIAVYTDKGRTELDWDHRRIFSAESYDHQGTRGSLNVRQLRAWAAEFGSRWFPGQTRGLQPRVEPLGPGNGPVLASYRRYRHHVLMPMRLDFTLARNGNLMALTTRFASDPALPAPRLSRAEAQRRAEAASGRTAVGPGFLLAEQVGGLWRPLWLVNVGTGGRAERAVRVDAVTGAVVVPDPPRDY